MPRLHRGAKEHENKASRPIGGTWAQQGNEYEEEPNLCPLTLPSPARERRYFVAIHHAPDCIGAPKSMKIRSPVPLEGLEHNKETSMRRNLIYVPSPPYQVPRFHAGQAGQALPSPARGEEAPRAIFQVMTAKPMWVIPVESVL